ncbi:MAG: dihydroorotase [Bacteroidaceae bacterium]|nr:dihydroorotase [Bacteroidaceae bacterium]
MNKLISNGKIVGEDNVFVGDILICGDRISKISKDKITDFPADTAIVDATGCYVLPGVIDTHVHFREPGLTHKADMESESRAAAFGGVTSFFDMPNCNPATVTLEALEQKQCLAAEKSHINYAFFLGATTKNTDLFPLIDKRKTPGVKLFMGSSTGNMLVDGDDCLADVFKTAADNGLIVMAHCEDNDIIKEQTKEVKQIYGDDADVALHPVIRNREACKKSSLKAMVLAKEYNTRLHIAHISTKEEAELFTQSAKELNIPVTFEACLPHIIFNDSDYATRGTRIKCNPAVKTEDDRLAIVKAINEGMIATVATDHAPHAIEEKQGGCLKAASGMPMLQFSLVAMLDRFDIQTVSRLMSNNPAKLFSIKDRGFLQEGFKADIAIVRREEKPWTLTEELIQSKCGWSPLTGDTFNWKVVHTFCNGNHILDNGTFNPTAKGEKIEFG